MEVKRKLTKVFTQLGHIITMMDFCIIYDQDAGGLHLESWKWLNMHIIGNYDKIVHHIEL
jgi:hypothetical protein